MAGNNVDNIPSHIVACIDCCFLCLDLVASL